MSLAVAVLVAAAATCTVPSPEEAAQLALPYAEFDSRERTVRLARPRRCRLYRPGRVAAGSLCRGKPRPPGTCRGREISFHIGQALAMAGREQEAIAPLEQALDAQAPPEWAAYVRATLAFLRRDPVALLAARESYQHSRRARRACESSMAWSRARPSPT